MIFIYNYKLSTSAHLSRAKTDPSHLAVLLIIFRVNPFKEGIVNNLNKNDQHDDEDYWNRYIFDFHVPIQHIHAEGDNQKDHEVVRFRLHLSHSNITECKNSCTYQLYKAI